ncbi:hypothetical protein BJX96DRAFT_171688 [Aspergillus floccosus]
MPSPMGAAFHGQASIRSSCERCRFQKLKCTGPAGPDSHGPCQRCARAKVDCVFGRRRPTSRISESKRGSEATTNNLSRPTLPSPLTPSTASVTPIVTIANGQRTEPAGDSTMFDMRGWDSVQLQDVMDKATNFANHLDNYDMPPANGLDDIFLFDANTENAAEGSSSSRPSQNPPVIAGDVCGNSDSSGLVQSLLSLLSEMQQRLRVLQEGPWQFGSTCGLDDYPIGTVLHLSQQFSTLVGPCLRGASVSCYDHMGPLPSVDGTPGDSLAMVLVLSGYMSLMRLYSIVLGHFQAHLSQISNQEEVLTRNCLSPTLQLGELPCASTTHGLGRIHMALCMLQDSLNSVEDQLGKGGEIARQMVITLLRKEALLSKGNLQDGESGLSRQATAVKGLLREKMSL